jgi:acyl-coenzyme A synthetase/AMP-(fatty) acid ligase
MTGRTQIILPRFELVAYLELVQKYKCNKGYIVPPILTAFAKHPIIDKYDLSSLRQYGLMCAAAPLSVELIDAVYDRLQIPIYQAMGMTEASPATHMSRIESWKEGKGGVGTLVPNMEARLVDIDGKDVAPGESGELWVRGPNIFLGYHNNPAATADCMSEDGYYKTGDVARIDPKTGNFYITDRVKELIKYKGFQVPPAELEGVLSAHPKIADVAVVGIWKEEEQTEVPRAYVVLQAGHAASKELEGEIAKWLEAKVAHYKKLRGGVRFVAEIPKNPSGKILRRVLKQQGAEEAKGAQAKL